MPKKKRAASSPAASINWKAFGLKVALFITSLLLAYFFITTEYAHFLIDKILPFKLFAAFFVGIFYTSFLTTPIALVALYLLAEVSDPLGVAVLGGFGAMVGDTILVYVFRNIFQDINSTRTSHLFFHKINMLLRSFNLGALATILGVIIVISPLPDELGLILLGATDMSYPKLLILSFTLNTIGLLLILSPLYLI